MSSVDLIEIRVSEDVVRVRHRTRELAVQAGMSLIDQTKLVTAASELARNTLEYGGGGTARFERPVSGLKKGVRITFEDSGPGIADVAQAMQDGFTSGSGMGLGLPGAKRLVNEFDIQSKPGQGTRVTITRWK